MNILEQLPDVLKQKVFLYLSHPTADLINDEINRLQLNRSYDLAFKFASGEKTDVTIDFIDCFIVEYFFHKNYYKYHADDTEPEFLINCPIVKYLLMKLAK